MPGLRRRCNTSTPSSDRRIFKTELATCNAAAGKARPLLCQTVNRTAWIVIAPEVIAANAHSSGDNPRSSQTPTRAASAAVKTVLLPITNNAELV